MYTKQSSFLPCIYNFTLIKTDQHTENQLCNKTRLQLHLLLFVFLCKAILKELIPMMFSEGMFISNWSQTSFTVFPF
jgi:hypothetical protein